MLIDSNLIIYATQPPYFVKPTSSSLSTQKWRVKASRGRRGAGGVGEERTEVFSYHYPSK
jgi:hypothetical protein